MHSPGLVGGRVCSRYLRTATHCVSPSFSHCVQQHLECSAQEAAAVADACVAHGPGAAEVLQRNIRALKARGILPRPVLAKSPAMAVFMPLETWLDFLEAYGFTAEQVKHMLGQAPEELQRATLGTAGTALTTLRSLGMDHTACKQLCTYYPQVLSMPPAQLASFCSLLGKYQHTHGC